MWAHALLGAGTGSNYSDHSVWLISSVRLLAPVNTIDGKQIGTPALQKELTAELTGLYAGIQ